MSEVLSRRRLNRALMARQLLAERSERAALDVIEHLVGLQGQEPLEPYTGLWSRLVGFRPEELVGLLEARRAARTLLMRRTLHLVSARDALAWRALHQPMLVGKMTTTLRRDMPGVDLDELTAAGRPLFDESPRTLGEVARAVGDRWPDVAPRVLGDALSTLVDLVQVPPRGIWGQTAPARNTTFRAWLGAPPSQPAAPADELVLRYLRAFGPAASADVRAWSGLTGLPAVIARLRPRLRTFRDERGRELLDVEDAPLPHEDTPQPPRFVPAFDNVVLGFDDRSRVIDDDHRRLSVAGARFLLVDGRVAGTWTVADDALRISELVPLRPADREDVTIEGAHLAEFLGLDPTAVRFDPPTP